MQKSSIANLAKFRQNRLSDALSAAAHARDCAFEDKGTLSFAPRVAEKCRGGAEV